MSGGEQQRVGIARALVREPVETQPVAPRRLPEEPARVPEPAIAAVAAV